MSWRERTELLLGPDTVERLSRSRVCVVGVGGVGALASEMLARAGIGSLTLVDSDEVAPSNINRQIIALHSTLGQPKVEVLGRRLLDINPGLELRLVKRYINEDFLRSDEAPGALLPADVVLDAIDTLSPKIALIQFCLQRGIPLVSSMGAGAKMDVLSVRIADISKTYECPLAHMLRKRLHKLGIREGFKAVFSVEKPIEGATVQQESENKKTQVGTISYLPAVFGCACTQAVIQSLLG